MPRIRKTSDSFWHVKMVSHQEEAKITPTIFATQYLINALLCAKAYRLFCPSSRSSRALYFLSSNHPIR